MNIDNELPLIYAAEKWAQENVGPLCDGEIVRIALKDVISELRFLTLTKCEFERCSTTPLLSREDQIAVKLFIRSGGTRADAKSFGSRINPEKFKRSATYQESTK
jgi:hypothetical protein